MLGVFVSFLEDLPRIFPKPPPDEVLAKQDKNTTEIKVGANIDVRAGSTIPSPVPQLLTVSIIIGVFKAI